MRRLVFAVAGVLAVSPLVGLASVSSPASAAVAHPAAAAAKTNCDYEPGNEFGGLGTRGPLTAGTELYVAAPGEAISTSTWCQDLDGVPAGYELLRMHNTTECAQYEGGPGGGDNTWVELAACDSSKLAQLWYSDTEIDQVVYNVYAGVDACLTSNNPDNTTAYTNAYLVPVSGGCGTGQGGQVWEDFPETT